MNRKEKKQYTSPTMKAVALQTEERLLGASVTTDDIEELKIVEDEVTTLMQL